MADSRSAKPVYKKEHDQNGFSSSKKPAQNHHAAYAVCGNWGIFRSSSCGRFYYHNSATGASHWEKPRDWTIKPDIEELIALHGGGGGSSSSQKDHVSTSQQRPSSSSFSHRSNAQQPSSSSSAKRPQYLIQQSSRNGESPHGQQHDSNQKPTPSSSSANTPYSRSSNCQQQFHPQQQQQQHNNDFSVSLDGPAKRRRHDGISPGGTPHSSGSGGSGNTSTQNKVLSHLSETLIQQVRDRLDVIKDRLGSSSTGRGGVELSSADVVRNNRTGSHGLSPSSDHHRPSATNTRLGSPSSKSLEPNSASADVAAVTGLSDSSSSSATSHSSHQNRLHANNNSSVDEPFGSLLQKCDRAISSLDAVVSPAVIARSPLNDLICYANDETGSKLDKQARRVREETVGKFDNMTQVALVVKDQRSVIRKIDILSEMNAKRVANIQRQIEELVGSRKDLASQLRQPSAHLAPFIPPPLSMSLAANSTSNFASHNSQR